MSQPTELELNYLGSLQDSIASLYIESAPVRLFTLNLSILSVNKRAKNHKKHESLKA